VAALVAWIASATLRSEAARSQPSPDAGVAAEVEALRDSANRRAMAGRFLAGLAFLRRIERLTPHTSADFEGAYATALGNAAVEARVERGLAIPVTRSSVERVSLLRDAFARVAAGEQKAERPNQARDLRVVRAGQLAFWGFVREGYQDFRSAHGVSPLDQKTSGQAGWLELRFLEPTSDDSRHALKEPGSRR